MTEKTQWPADEDPMDVSQWPVDNLIPYARNPRINDESVDAVAASIKAFGFRQPIVVDEDNVILVGHTRLKAARRLGMTEVPVHVARGLTDAECKAYRIMDNRAGHLSEWDTDLLRLEIDELEDAEFDIDLTGFDADDLAELIDAEEREQEEKYTRKIEAPIYEPSGPKPAISELYSDKKTQELLNDIEQADIPGEIKEFLRVAANRHTVLKFGKIANYYAQSDRQIQDLMERSALVIIDFDKAIEYGFVTLSDELTELTKQQEIENEHE